MTIKTQPIMALAPRGRGNLSKTLNHYTSTYVHQRYVSNFRGAVEVIGGQHLDAPGVEEPPRMSVSEAFDDNYRDVQPKTYQVLDEELPKAEATG